MGRASSPLAQSLSLKKYLKKEKKKSRLKNLGKFKSKHTHFEFPVPRSGSAMPPRTEVKPKSVRKPLRDLPNNNNGGGGLSKSANLKKKSRSDRQIEDEALDDDSTLDRLLLVQSDLSSLLQQVYLY